MRVRLILDSTLAGLKVQGFLRPILYRRCPCLLPAIRDKGRQEGRGQSRWVSGSCSRTRRCTCTCSQWLPLRKRGKVKHCLHKRQQPAGLIPLSHVLPSGCPSQRSCVIQKCTHQHVCAPMPSRLAGLDLHLLVCGLAEESDVGLVVLLARVAQQGADTNTHIHMNTQGIAADKLTTGSAASPCQCQTRASLLNLRPPHTHKHTTAHRLRTPLTRRSRPSPWPGGSRRPCHHGPR
jgi:hypothetical protein